jgi:hypothetical protein
VETGEPGVQRAELLGDPVPVPLGEAGADAQALLDGGGVRDRAHRCTSSRRADTDRVVHSRTVTIIADPSLGDVS